MKDILLILTLLVTSTLYSQTVSSIHNNVLKYANQVENHILNINKLPIHSKFRKQKMIRAAKKSSFKPVVIILNEGKNECTEKSKVVFNYKYTIFYIEKNPDNTTTLTYYEYPYLKSGGYFYEITFDHNGKEIKQRYGSSY